MKKGVIAVSYYIGIHPDYRGKELLNLVWKHHYQWIKLSGYEYLIGELASPFAELASLRLGSELLCYLEYQDFYLLDLALRAERKDIIELYQKTLKCKPRTAYYIQKLQYLEKL